MKEQKKPQIKNLHPRNLHIHGYDFELLTKKEPFLEKYVIETPYGRTSIDFADPKAVKTLNKALLKTYYKIEYWDIADTNLCPPIPSRADYIHHIADEMIENGEIPTGTKVKVLDIGTGANLIYPILGVSEYDWTFVGSECDKQAFKNANKLIERNKILNKNVTMRFQENKRFIFKNIIQENEYFDFVICNPPFFKSKEEALAKTVQKLTNLGKEVTEKPVMNFSGQNNELWYDGGEKAFITSMIYESKHFRRQSVWFSTLVSQKENVKPLLKLLQKVEVKESKVIDMNQGNKVSRILLWKF